MSSADTEGLQKTGVQINLPAFDRGKRRDVLFFTGELSTLLNAGVPLDRALSITAELTERASFRALVTDVLRMLKGGKSLADSLATHPAHFSELYINMVRAGEASGSLAQIFERLAEFERTRDDLRGYIISSLIYPDLLTLVGIASIFILLNFVVPRFALIFSDPHMKIPTPTLLMLQASADRAGLVAARRHCSGRRDRRASIRYIRTTAGRLWWDTLAPAHSAAGRRAAQGRNRRASRAPWPRWSPPACRWCNRSASRAAF